MLSKKLWVIIRKSRRYLIYEEIVICTNKGEKVASNHTKCGKAYIDIAKRISGMAIAEDTTKFTFRWRKKRKHVQKIQSQGL